MTIETIGRTASRLALVAVLAVFVAANGCGTGGDSPAKRDAKKVPTSADSDAKQRDAEQPVTETPAPKKTAATAEPKEKDLSLEKGLSEELEQVQEKPRDLGPPLVDNVPSLTRLNPEQPVWIDPKNKQVVLQGETCQAGYPLEFFATYSNRAYESVLSVNVTPSFVHAGLLAVGAKPGHPAQFKPGKTPEATPEIVPASGTAVAIEVRWKDKNGKRQSARAQDWVRDRKTKKALDSDWVFAGSLFVKDEETGKEYYQADSGELICVLSLPTAMLDLPMRGYGAIEARSFEAFAERLPPAGTPVTLLLRPSTSTATTQSKSEEKPTPPAAGQHAEAEQAAIEAAEAWFALADRGEYARAWETSAEYFRDVTDRRDFIKMIGAARKSFGALKSRELASKHYTTRLPGVPDGQYVVLEYKSSFENKAAAFETITPMLDKDKKWRVSGYYIK